MKRKYSIIKNEIGNDLYALVLKSWLLDEEGKETDVKSDDTSAFIQINDIVTENKLQDRKLIFQNRKPIIINTTITNIGEIPSTKFYLGAGFKTDINPILNNPQININALLVMKKRWAYEVEVGFPFNNIKNINVGFNAFYKISYKKR